MSNRLREDPDQAAGAAAPAAALVLEQSISELEKHLAVLREALKHGETGPLDTAVAQLLACVTRSRLLTHQLNPQTAAHVAAYRVRLKRAAVELQAQREALTRASASLERAAEVLIPAGAETYDAQGLGLREWPRGDVTA